ncbi:MAG: hypothetical protein R6X13_01175 [bacterium]
MLRETRKESGGKLVFELSVQCSVHWTEQAQAKLLVERLAEPGHKAMAQARLQPQVEASGQVAGQQRVQEDG